MSAENTIIRRINIKNFNNLHERILNKIEEISKIGINTDSLKQELNVICDDYKLEMSTLMEYAQIPTIKKYIQELQSFLENLINYDYFLELHQEFETYQNNLSNILTKEEIEMPTNTIITKLEELKNKEEFQNENYTSFIYNIYKICYEYLKSELILNNESKLFDYFTSNEHDFWYINEFVKISIEDIQSSINYVFNYDKLKLVIESKENSNHFMYKNIIKEIAICENPNYYKDVCEKEFEKFEKRFNAIYFELILPSDWYGEMFKRTPSKKKIAKLKQDLKKLKQEYEEFIIDKDFLNEYNDIEIQNIKIINLRIQKLLKEIR